MKEHIPPEKKSGIYQINCKDCENIPSPGINIDTSVNAAFTGNRLNAAKSYVDITDC